MIKRQKINYDKKMSSITKKYTTFINQQKNQIKNYPQQIEHINKKVQLFIINQLQKAIQEYINDIQMGDMISLRFKIIQSLHKLYLTRANNCQEQKMNELQNIYQMLNVNFNSSALIKRTKIVISPPMVFVPEEEFDQYTPQIKSLYGKIFASMYDSQETKAMQIKLNLNFPIKETPMPICNKILNPDQPVFRCYDCMTHQASVLCKKCFENANHKGHRYSQIASGGGNCDCGNPDAIKPVGFCVDHPGKAQPVNIDPKQRQNFLEKTLVLFEWIFRLNQVGKSKSSDILGQIVADQLYKLNERSLYYNTLTYNLLMSKRKYGSTNKQKQQKVLEKVFQYGVKLVNFARRITDVFLNMFSLEIFKYELTEAFTMAYNKYPNFQTSRFKSLYIQLYANNDILERLLVEKQLVLYPETQQYDYSEYIENLMFLSTIKSEVASKFFILLNQKGIVKIPLMDEIQKTVQTKGEHIVSLISNNLNIQNFYYLLMSTFIKLIKNCQPSMIQMLKNYINAVMDEKYSYKKNKVIMPFHKILSMILLSIYQGELQKINAQQIQKFIQGKYRVKDVFLKVFKMILQCFKQFSKTLFETSYFDNYIPLYAKSGNLIIVFDLLMFSISIGIFKQLNLQQKMNEILSEIFNLPKEIQEKIKPSLIPNSVQKNVIEKMQVQNDDDFESISSTSETDSQQIIRKLKMNTQLLKIMIESCVSNRSQILVSNSTKIDNPIIKERTEKLFIKVMNNFKQITGQNLKQINKVFIESKNIEEDLIKKFLIFDKNKKKYTLNETKNQKMSDKKFPLFLCSSLKKYGGIFAKQKTQPLENLLMSLQVPLEKLEKLKFVLNEKFLNQVINEFIKNLTQLKNKDDKQIEKVFLDFVQVMRTLQYLLKEQVFDVITNFFQQLIQLSQKQEFKFLNQQAHKKIALENKQQKKQSTKLKFQEMKKKKLQRMKQMQSTFDNLLQKQKIQEETNESLCIICREDKPGLCFLANFNYSNALQALTKVQGRFLVFNSCFHPIHISCFTSSSKRDSIPCPLCKTESNIMLPFEKQISNIKIINEIFERIITLRAAFRQIYHGFDKQYEQYGILSIFRSLTSMIGKNILQGQAILNHKDQRLANILYNMTKNLAHQQFKKSRTQQEIQAIKNFLQQLKKKIHDSKQQNNFYVLEYVALKIFYLCFIQRSQECLQILKQPCIGLLNKNDLKKIWDMCGQIANLPHFTEHEETKVEAKEMSSKITFYSPPETVFQLIKIRDEASNLCKNGHQICICVMCEIKSCLDCRQTLRHSSKVHCGEYIAFNLQTGGLEYYMDTRVVHFPSLYENQTGFEWKPSKSPEGFKLDRDTYEELKKSIVNDSILKFLNRKYPESFKKSLFFEMGLF